MMRKIKKFIASALIAVILFASLPVTKVRAQEDINPFFGTGPWYSQSLGQFYSKVYDDSNPQEIFGERYTASQVEWIIWTLLSWPFTKLFGPEIPLCLFTKDVGYCLEEFDEYFIPGASSTEATSPVLADQNQNKESLVKLVFEDRPLSGVTYFKDILRKHSIISEAQAQQEGFGYTTALEPVQDMWKGARNIAYTLFVVVIIALSFMIMFRVKISPQVVIGVQSAIPRIVIAIILVTFSFAIAGLLVDLMYVVIGLLSILMKNFWSGAGPSASVLFNFLTKGKPFGANAGVGGGFGVFALVIMYVIFFTAGALITAILVFGPGISLAIGAIATLGLAITGSLGGIILALLFILLVVMLIVHAFKIFFMLIKAYINVILLVIFAPLQFVLGALVPSMGISAWLKNFISNLAVFVVTGVLFALSFIFLFQGMSSAYTGFRSENVLEKYMSFWWGTGMEQMVTGDAPAGWPPLLGIGGSAGTALLFLAVSAGLFFLIPKTADAIKAAIAGQPFAYGTAIGQAITGVPTAIWTSQMMRSVREAGGSRIAGRILERVGLAAQADAGNPQGNEEGG